MIIGYSTIHGISVSTPNPQPPKLRDTAEKKKKKAGKVVGAIGERDVKYWLWDTQQSDYAMISYDYLHKTKPSKFQQEWGRGF